MSRTKRPSLRMGSLPGVVVAGVASMIFATAAVGADATLKPAEVVRVCSPDKKFCATGDPQAARIFVFQHGSSSARWSLAGWHRSFFLANDGDHLVVGPDELNLLPLDTRPTDPLLVFYKRNARIRIVRVADLIPDLSTLEQTVSHYAWGSVRGINSKNQLTVELASGKRVVFDVTTGEIVSASK